MSKISVCVPSYNRPDMMRQLINSFINQNYEDKELIISDDSSNLNIKNLVEDEYGHINSIKYFKNEKNLGYCKNFLKSIERATGDYIIILGDDDILLSEKALEKYVTVFEENKSVGYIYSNQVQFSKKLDVEHIFNIQKHNKLFEKGEESIKNTWLTSIFIPGIGLRNNIKFSEYYPDKDMIFPQLELIGNIINMNDSYILSDTLIAGRAHDEQLGFLAIKNQLIKGEEKHGTVELFDIFDKLKEKYNLKISRDFLEKHLIKNYSTMIIKEKLITNNKLVTSNYANFTRISKLAKKSIIFNLGYLLAIILPKFIIKIIKFTFTLINKVLYFEDIKNYNSQLKKIIKK